MLNEVRSNVYRETYLPICFTERTKSIFIPLR